MNSDTSQAKSVQTVMVKLSVFMIVVCFGLSACDRNSSDGSGNSSSPLSLLDGDTDDEQSSDTEVGNKSGSALTRHMVRGKVLSHLLLGTGSVQGIYFPVGGVICRLLNRHMPLHRIRCSLESTGGSIQNLRDLRAGSFDMVFAQSDWQHHAYNGTSTFEKEGANTELRAVFALEPDPLALIVKDSSEVKGFDDLENRVVSFGYARSLQHRIINDLLAAKGWTDDNFKTVRRMSDTKQVGELCADKVEAILLLSSSLNDYLEDLPEECELRLVNIEGPEIATIIKDKPYYRVGSIPRGMHLDSKSETKSFGLGATFVAQESTSPKAIYHIVKEVVENFKDFQSLHPSLQTLSKKELPFAGISAPLHPGAIRYYKEARLLK